MRRLANIRLVGLLFLFGVPSCVLAQSSADGYWKGTAGAPNGQVDLMVSLISHSGKFSGTLDIPASGLVAEPLSNINFAPPKAHFDLNTDLGVVTFDGEVKENTISGKLQMGPNALPFSLARSTAPPPTYKQEEVRFQNGEITLAGTLILPLSKAPHPAVIFVHASGAQSRFGIGERGRADQLVRQGIAVLVYDKRGVDASTGDWRRASFGELAADVLAGVQSLKQRKDINPKQIGLYGRSQGAWIIELAASRSKDVALLIPEVGGGVPVWQQASYAVGAQMSADGYPKDQIDEAMDFVRFHYQVARGEKSWEQYAAVVEKVKTKKWIDLKKPWQSLAQAKLSWEKLGSYDPGPLLEKLSCPVLALFAELDTSTPTEDSVASMKKAFAKGGNRDFTYKIFPRADHAMLIYPTGGLPQLPRDYIDTKLQWILKRVDVPK